MDIKGEVLLQLFNKRKSRDKTKTFLDQSFSLFIVKLKKLGFSAFNERVTATKILCIYTRHGIKE